MIVGPQMAQIKVYFMANPPEILSIQVLAPIDNLKHIV